ncbi:MAG: TonB-dependent receptor [Rickettsiales bacterium]|nr:TonB-dependent receptor [Rickettsiales bacterium]|tara:strand:+ start:10367 stop:12709 length:2343 start_codon:yes stop_codon:yes gene_type:complete
MKNITTIFFFIPFVFFSQIDGSINGYVFDAKSQLPLFGANVIIEGTEKGSITDDKGFFEITNISPKSYNLSVSYIGYKSKKIFNIIIKSKGNQTLEILLAESNEELDEVIVFESPFKKSKETPLSINSFSRVEIESYPGADNDVTKVVQSMPGMSPSIGGFRNDIIIRGGAPNETVYYLDEIEIPNINHFSTQGSAGGPQGMINISFIDEVTLSTSAFGVEYDNPLSGVLQFDQKNGNTKEISGNFRFGASDSAITIEGPFTKSDNNKTTFIFSARKSYLQFLFELIGLPIRPDYWDFQWKVNHKINDFNSINFIGLGAIDDFSVEAPDDFDSTQQAFLEQVPIIKQNSSTIGISWIKKFKEKKGQFVLALSSNKLKNIFSRFSDNENLEGLYFKNNSHEWETKLRVKTVNYINDWKIKWGGNIQYSDYHNNTNDIYNQINYLTKFNFYKYGLYGNVSKSFLGNKLDFSLGVRTDEDNFSKGSKMADNISPRISISYSISNDRRLKWNSSFGIYYKIPTYTILGFKNITGDFTNRRVKYTKSNHLVTGFDYSIGNASKISIEGFIKKYEQFPISVLDGISLANKGADFEVLGNEEIISIGRGKTRGIEFLFQQKLTNNFYGIFSYTIFKSEFTDINGDYLPSVWDSKHLSSFSGGYKLKRNWEISSRWRFAGKTPYVPYNLDASLANYPNMVLDYSELGNLKLDNFSQLDVRLDKKWNKEKISINFFIEILNLLAQKIPIPKEYGLNRDNYGNIINPLSLVEVDVNRESVVPSFGFSIDF